MLMSRDVDEIMIHLPEVLHFEKRCVKVMARSDWGKKILKRLKHRITQRTRVSGVTRINED